jgi:hypothetical protein
MPTLTTTRPVPEDYGPRAIKTILARRVAKQKPAEMALGAFPVHADDPLREMHGLIDAYLREAGKNAFDAKPAKLLAGLVLLQLPPDHKGMLVRAILARVLYYWIEAVQAVPDGLIEGHIAWRYGDEDGWQAAIPPLGAALRKRGEIDVPEEGLLDWLEGLCVEGQVGCSVDGSLSAVDWVSAARVRIAKDGLSPTMADALRRMKKYRDDLYHGWGREEQQLQRDVDELLGNASPLSKLPVEPGEPWAEAVLATLADKSSMAAAKWADFVKYVSASDGSKPTGKWLKGAKQQIDAVGVDAFRRCAVEWLTLAVKPRTKPLEQGQVAYGWDMSFDIYSDKNEAVLKGLAWACGAAQDATLNGALGALAEACYTKIRNYGPRSPKVGNACLISLISLPGQEPRAELSRLKAKVKQPTARKMIDKAIGVSAAAAGMTPDDLEELAVGTYGLTEVGRGERKVGAYTVELKIAGTTKVELNFTDAKGKSRASVPADLKDGKDAAAFKEIQQQSKDLAKMLPALRDRIERLPMSRRELPTSAWRARYLDHPVVATIARRLIWTFGAGEKSDISGAWLDGTLVDANDKPLRKLDEDETRVRLWHPVGSPPADVLAWRQFLQRHEITQPFKQAYREVYLLTDAERRTATYSNRFAAHVLRQSQFAALCTQRGWTYRLMGSWDGGGDTTPSVELPAWKLRAEYWLTGGEGDEDDRFNAVAQHVFTDQVRFYKAGESEPMPIADVPPLALSEVMRDVDLFVGVASLGNDPNWVPEGDRVGDYWQRYSFGDLSTTAETRREVLASLLPRLKIADRAKLADRFLVVTGTLRTYKIHLGSGNILMEPNDQYLCIVPDRTAAAAAKTAGGRNLYLPFEGDQTLSVILSKAFLLADDAKITDETILSQIRR